MAAVAGGFGGGTNARTTVPPRGQAHDDLAADLEKARYVRSRSQAIRSKPPKHEGYFLHKVILITGASSGIGRALAYWYLSNGARVALVGRDLAELDRIAKNYPG